MGEKTELSLYNGVSNRSRGWKSRTFGDVMDGQAAHVANIKRWDGAARMCYDWDNLRRDPELWYRNGNCFVHLYGQGQSKRGPAFKIPFAALLESRCRPLIERFMVMDVPESPRSDGSAGMDFWSKANQRVDLYIPSPPGSNKTQALLYHLATRNFFAWIFRRSLVGEHLGDALAGLITSMHEFRSMDADNANDLMHYLDEEGYLDLRGQPNHALGLLHMAETLQMRNMYIDAFAHCVGMNDRLFVSSEYQQITSTSRKFIRRARADMQCRLGRAGTMLRTFLEDDLSESHLGLSGGARVHLDRFRTFLLGFYTNKFGYYPPPSTDSRSTVFEPEVFRRMTADFEALYNYLVDETFTPGKSSPFLAQGGICILQSVESFDQRHKFTPLPHPLPLLPEISASVSSRRMSWLGKAPKTDKLRPDNRLVAHSALMKATNKSRVELFNSDLVCAYRKFEEDAIFSPHKADRMEKISQVDARKLRWILIYAVYQTLRSCTQAPPEVREAKGVPYSLAISTDNLPPWEEMHRQPPVFRRQTDMAMMTRPSTAASDSVSSSQRSVEIKPDIDYFAITHRHASPSPSCASRSIGLGPPVIPPRSRSLTRNLSRNGSILRSLSIFRSNTPVVEAPPPPRRPAYHEILVHGYGNGTNDVNMFQSASADVEEVHEHRPQTAGATMATRSPSTSSNSSTGSSSAGHSDDKSDTSAPMPESPRTDYTATPPPLEPDKTDLVPVPAPPARGRPALARGVSATSSVYSQDGGAASDSDLAGPPPAVPARSRARPLSVFGTPSGAAGFLQPEPLRIRKEAAVLDPEAWRAMQREMERGTTAAARRTGSLKDDIKPEWEQFWDLGGHTVLTSASVNF